jgi:C4-dicarboxylate transporter DctM subunit
MINVFLLVVGCLIEGIPAMLILIPVMMPVITDLGVDPVHFGVILIFNLLVGIITPPMGIGLFIMSGITGLKVEEVFKGCVPYLLPLIVTLLLVTYVPAVSLFLPDLLLPVR